LVIVPLVLGLDMQHSPEGYFFTSGEDIEFEQNNDQLDPSGLSLLFAEYTRGADYVAEQPP
jgi:hypothetical protein